MTESQERIYNWQDSQLSIARHYGGININGVKYVIAYEEEGQPLVRFDCLKAETKAKAKTKTKDKANNVSIACQWGALDLDLG